MEWLSFILSRYYSKLMVKCQAYSWFIYTVKEWVVKAFFYYSLPFLIFTLAIFIFSGVCATLTVLKPTSILSVLPMGNLMIMHVRSKKHHARNRRKLKSCLWVDVKVMLLAKFISKNTLHLSFSGNFLHRNIKVRAGLLLGSPYISV